MNMTEQRNAILTILKKSNRPLGPKAIAAAANMKPRNVAMLLLRMKSDGQIRHHEWGQWTTAHGG